MGGGEGRNNEVDSLNHSVFQLNSNLEGLTGFDCITASLTMEEYNFSTFHWVYALCGHARSGWELEIVISSQTYVPADDLLDD
jgi:hypothetical protein